MGRIAGGSDGRSRGASALLVLCLGTLLAAVAVTPALAAGPPILGATWASKVDARSAQLNAEIDPNGNTTGAYFEYATRAAYEASGFAGAKRVNLNNVGSGSGSVDVHFPLIAGLAPGTTYLYRLTATNVGGSAEGPPSPPYPFFVTQALGGDALLLDGRGWEMVSPLDKNGGEVAAPGAIAAGGALQAAGQGGEVTYGSAASFAGGEGAPPASQYLATRTAAGWATENLTVPIFSGSYDTHEGGSPYRLFSTDLARGLLLNGKSCRGEATEGCPVANPPLPGTGAPAGFQDYYLRTTASAGFESLLGAGEVSGLDPADFELVFVGASPDLGEVLLESCSALAPGAADTCGGPELNLYRWSQSAGAIVFLDSAVPAQLAIEASAIAAPSALAYYTEAGELYRYSATSEVSTKLTSSGDVEGALGAAADGSHLYFLRAGGLYLCLGAAAAGANGCDAATKVADSADPSNYPPETGTARVSADGTKLLFLATAPLTGFDNADANTKAPDSQVYLYDAGGAGSLRCLSCNPTNGRPIGPSTIPGAIANGAGPTATVTYKPRVLVDGGRRVFFESRDDLALTDTNSGAPDAYEWEAAGEGSCTAPGGCLSLISSGRDAGGARFVDASAEGADAFFLTAGSLVGPDPGGVDLYDARVGGGFPEASEPIACEGDACQILPPEPTDPTLTTLLQGPGNPAVKYTRYKHHFKKPHKKKHHPKRHHRKGGRR